MFIKRLIIDIEYYIFVIYNQILCFVVISYVAVGIQFPLIKRKIITRWIRQVLVDYHKKLGDITCIFCSNNEILRINSCYLEHNYYTDIITFDYSKGDIVSGDLFIAPSVVKYNSVKYGSDYFEELYRVIIHGILHLCGFNDKLFNEMKIMRENENKALKKIQL